MTKAERERRNEEIVRLHIKEGLLLRDLGERFGISAEAVRKIVRAAGVTPEQSADATGRGRTLWRCEHCRKEERRRSGRRELRYCSVACANAAGATTAGATAAGATAAWRYTYTEAELLEHLRRLASGGLTPGHEELEEVGGPSAHIYYRRFGSLQAAQRRAGLMPNTQGPLGHKSQRGE